MRGTEAATNGDEDNLKGLFVASFSLIFCTTGEICDVTPQEFTKNSFYSSSYIFCVPAFDILGDPSDFAVK